MISLPNFNGFCFNMAHLKGLILLDHLVDHSRLIDHIVSKNRFQKYGPDHDRYQACFFQ